MIIDNAAAGTIASAAGDGGATLHDMLADLAKRRPAALAVADPPNRPAFTDGAARRLSFVEADRIVTAIASRLRHMDLPTDAVIGIQLPNIVESALAILGVLRAGMIAAPLPLLWRRADMVTALAPLGAKALITCSRAGSFRPAQLAMVVAADVFSIRYVCGFGAALPDGIVGFDDLFDAAPDPLPPRQRDSDQNATAHVAVITFEEGADGIIPVARNHTQLGAAAGAMMVEGSLAADGHIVSTLLPVSLAGICLTLMLWLRSGGALSLHHPFDRRAFADQVRAAAHDGVLVLPGPVAMELADTEGFGRDSPACVLAAWRRHDQFAGSATWRMPHTAFVDIVLFGGIGMVAGRRSASGMPVSIPERPVAAPRDGRFGEAAGINLPSAAVFGGR